jgi:sugar phosphate isomerase/epimerase
MAGAVPLAATGLAQTRTVPIGIELYSVRNELMKDPKGTVAAVAKVGYQVVEFYSPYYSWTLAEAKDMRKLLDDLGIKCLSTHNGGVSISADGIAKAIELNQAIGSKYIIVASAGKVSGADGWKGFADQLTAAAEKLRPLGMATGFHNHQTEWRPIEGTAQRPMDILAAGTPKDVALQLDCGTCVEAGADPVAWIKANPGRIKSTHLKDWSKASGYAVAFGEGDVPWKPLIAAAESTGGVEYHLIEQETSAFGEGVAMAARCLANYKKLRG